MGVKQRRASKRVRNKVAQFLKNSAQIRVSALLRIRELILQNLENKNLSTNHKNAQNRRLEAIDLELKSYASAK